MTLTNFMLSGFQSHKQSATNCNAMHGICFFKDNNFWLQSQLWINLGFKLQGISLKSWVKFHPNRARKFSFVLALQLIQSIITSLILFVGGNDFEPSVSDIHSSNWDLKITGESICNFSNVKIWLVAMHICYISLFSGCWTIFIKNSHRSVQTKTV